MLRPRAGGEGMARPMTGIALLILETLVIAGQVLGERERLAFG